MIGLLAAAAAGWSAGAAAPQTVFAQWDDQDTATLNEVVVACRQTLVSGAAPTFAAASGWRAGGSGWSKPRPERQADYRVVADVAKARCTFTAPNVSRWSVEAPVKAVAWPQGIEGAVTPSAEGFDIVVQNTALVHWDDEDRRTVSGVITRCASHVLSDGVGALPRLPAVWTRWNTAPTPYSLRAPRSDGQTYEARSTTGTSGMENRASCAVVVPHGDPVLAREYLRDSVKVLDMDRVQDGDSWRYYWAGESQGEPVMTFSVTDLPGAVRISVATPRAPS